MPDLTLLANAEDCPPGSAIEVAIQDRIIAVFNVDGEFTALDGICPHQGGPLGKGEMCGGIVTCPWHQWQFAVKSGHCLISSAIEQPKIELHIENDRIYARL